MLYIIVAYFALKDRTFKTGLLSLLIGVFTGVIASVFLIFTAVMFYDQVEVIITNQTEVEKRGNMHGVKKTKIECLKLAMGERVISWFNPFQDSPEPDYSEELYYENDKSKNE